MFPTFCEIAGAKVPDGLDGISLVPELRGESQAKHRYLYWEFSEHGGQARRPVWVKTGAGRRSNAISRKNSPARSGSTISKTTLAEKSDVAAAHPELVAEAEKIFHEAHTPSPIWSFPFDPAP